MMQGTKRNVITRTQGHTIKVLDGYLTIEGEQRTLAPDETEQLLDVLAIWRYGLEVMPLDTGDDELPEASKPD